MLSCVILSEQTGTYQFKRGIKNMEAGWEKGVSWKSWVCKGDCSTQSAGSA